MESLDALQEGEHINLLDIAMLCVFSRFELIDNISDHAVCVFGFISAASQTNDAVNKTLQVTVSSLVDSGVVFLSNIVAQASGFKAARIEGSEGRVDVFFP